MQEKRAKSIKSGVDRAKSFIYVNDLFRFTAVTNLKVSEQRQLRLLGLVYFVYLFIYSGLEFTLTFFTHHVFNYTSMEQGWMFFAIGKISENSVTILTDINIIFSQQAYR